MDPASRFASLRRFLGQRRLTVEPAIQYPLAIVNVTNRCNLRCDYCFVFRDGNPNDPAGEMSPRRVLAEVERLRDRHGIRWAVWMGGEPMLRWRLLEEGVRLFPKNTIVSNGTVPLRDFGPSVTYTVSLDGPRDLNDAARGAGVFDRALANIERVPEAFASTVMVQCVVHRENQHRHPDFVWNSGRSLDLMRPATARLVTDHCPLMELALPLYLEGDHFAAPLCCYGNDVDCDRCGSWGVFANAARMPGPWDAVLRGCGRTGPVGGC